MSAEATPCKVGRLKQKLAVVIEAGDVDVFN